MCVRQPRALTPEDSDTRAGARDCFSPFRRSLTLYLVIKNPCTGRRLHRRCKWGQRGLMDMPRSGFACVHPCLSIWCKGAVAQYGLTVK